VQILRESAKLLGLVSLSALEQKRRIHARLIVQVNMCSKICRQFLNYAKTAYRNRVDADFFKSTFETPPHCRFHQQQTDTASASIGAHEHTDDRRHAITKLAVRRYRCNTAIMIIFTDDSFVATPKAITANDGDREQVRSLANYLIIDPPEFVTLNNPNFQLHLLSEHLRATIAHLKDTLKKSDDFIPEKSSKTACRTRD
jgi:hypothetical protein